MLPRFIPVEMASAPADIRLDLRRGAITVSADTGWAVRPAPISLGMAVPDRHGDDRFAASRDAVVGPTYFL